MERPLSPFMFPVWYRFQITSALSILHRLTGIGLAVLVHKGVIGHVVDAVSICNC